MTELLLPDLDFHKAIRILHTDDIRTQLRKANKIFRIVQAKNHTTAMHGTIQFHSHPVIEDWEPYENTLALLMNICILTITQRTVAKLPPLYKVFFPVKKPEWLTQSLVNKYRRELLIDRPDFYSQYEWLEPLYSGG